MQDTTPTDHPGTSQKKQSASPRQERGVAFFLIPYGVGLFFLVGIPGFITLALAFFHYDGVNPLEWVGTLNFQLVFTDSTFFLSLENTLALVLIPVSLRICWAYLLANLFSGKGKWLAWLRSTVFLPSLTPLFVLVLAMMWVFNPLFGPLNIVLRTLGLPAPGWLADPGWALLTLSLLGFWTVGEAFLCILAALSDIPGELMDAARLDGARTSQIQRHLVMPLLAPLLVLLLMRDIALAIQNSYLITRLTTQGGPYYSTFTLPQYALEQGFELMSFGTAAAALWILAGLTAGLFAVVYWIARTWQVELIDGWFQ